MKTYIFYDGVMTYIIPSNKAHVIDFDADAGYPFVETNDNKFYFLSQLTV